MGDGDGRGSESMYELRPRNIKDLKRVLAMLANEHRLRIIALLAEKPMYISEIQRELGVSYALAHLYMSSLEKLGIVEGKYEMVTEGKPHVRKYYKLRPFRLVLTPDLIRELARGGESG